MSISMNTLKDDIDRAFRVLGAERGFSQNVIFFALNEIKISDRH